MEASKQKEVIFVGFFSTSKSHIKNIKKKIQY